MWPVQHCVHSIGIAFRTLGQQCSVAVYVGKLCRSIPAAVWRQILKYGPFPVLDGNSVGVAFQSFGQQCLVALQVGELCESMPKYVGQAVELATSIKKLMDMIQEQIALGSYRNTGGWLPLAGLMTF